MVTTDTLNECIKYLVATDDLFARAKSYMSGIEKQEKTILAIKVLWSNQKTQGLKDAEARTSSEYQEWSKKYTDAVFDYETFKSKRTTAALIVELYRSELSARKAGMIV